MTGACLYGLVDLDKQLSEVQQALVDYDSGNRRNVAVIGEPLAGKTALINAVISRYGKPIQKMRLTSVTGEADDILAGAGPEKIIAIDDCQYLFLRRIGGFTALEKFLESVASSDSLYITVWNKYAWDYLEQVFTLRDYFPATITIPALDTADITAIIGTHYDLGNIRYIYDVNEKGRLVKVKWRVIRIGGFNISVPFAVPGTGIISSALGESVSDARHLIFEKITGLSHGNPGVALAIWGRAYSDGEIKISKVVVPDYETDLSPDEAFVLGNILMTKTITEEDLLKITAGHLKMDRILYMLVDRGLINKKSGLYSIEPLALHSVVESLKKSRQVW